MPSTAAPFGLKPVYHPSGTVRPESGTIITAYAADLLQYQVVKIGTDGTLQAAAAGERAVGVFMGVEYYDTQGRYTESNHWVASTALKANTVAIAYYTRDPNIRYEIQSTTAVNQADLGNQADWANATAGSTTTGLSAATLSDTRSSSGSAGLRIVDFGHEVDNAPGDTYTNVIVMFSEHQDVADQVGYGG